MTRCQYILRRTGLLAILRIERAYHWSAIGCGVSRAKTRLITDPQRRLARLRLAYYAKN